MNSPCFRTTAFAVFFLLVSSVVHAQVVWIDVRSAIEHKIDHIDGDIRIPHDEIVERVSALYPDKSIEIHLYCRSGGRAGKAMSALQEVGYSNVKNIGSIDEARQRRGLED